MLQVDVEPVVVGFLSGSGERRLAEVRFGVHLGDEVILGARRLNMHRMGN